ncbi:Gfo/Idh/MocA family oxidoreductase [Agrobacterium pusense]|uniref:Gfo/Idh/MocA family protein n=1 Tax=Agrobacterium pusense TaxID=648995 RepID=UPI0039C9C7C6
MHTCDRSMDEGWRAKRDIAGGGALIDMGYHLIDLVIWFLGMPEIVMARTSGSAKPDQKYDVEDTAHLLLAYEPTTRRPNPLSANCPISRSYGEKGESTHSWNERCYCCRPTRGNITEP